MFHTGFHLQLLHKWKQAIQSIKNWKFRRKHVFFLWFPEKCFLYFFQGRDQSKKNGANRHQIPERGKSRQYTPFRSAWIQQDMLRRPWKKKWIVGERVRGVYGKPLRGSSCRSSAVAVAEPRAAACPIDFGSATNWTIFHAVMLRASTCLFSYSAVQQSCSR